MPVPHSDILVPPRCEHCCRATTSIGKLPRIGIHPLVYVYKCGPCKHITSVEPERPFRERSIDPPRSAAEPQQVGSKNA